MGDYGLFESDEAAQAEPRLAAKTAGRKMEAAVEGVRRDFGRFLVGATGIDEFEDRWHLSKNDIRASVEPLVFPNTGTMRRIKNALKQDWKLAHPYKLAMDHDDAGFGSMPEGDGPPRNLHLDKTYHPSSGNLIPSPDFEGWKDSVDQNGPEKVEANDFTPGGDSGSARSARRRQAKSFTLNPDSQDWIGHHSDQDLDDNEAFWSGSGGDDIGGDQQSSVLRMLQEERNRRNAPSGRGADPLVGSGEYHGGDFNPDMNEHLYDSGLSPYKPDEAKHEFYKDMMEEPPAGFPRRERSPFDDREAARLVADIYADFAQSNGLRVASLDTLDHYASTGIAEADFRLLAGLIVRQAEAECDDDEDADSEAPEASESDESDSDDDEGEDYDFGGSGDSEGDSDSDGGDDSDDEEYDFGGGDESGGEDQGGGQQYTVPDQAPELDPQMLNEIPHDNPQGAAPVPPNVVDSLLGLPEGTIEQLLLEEVQQGQGGDPSQGMDPSQGGSDFGGDPSAPQGGGDDFLGGDGGDPEQEPQRMAARRRQARQFWAAPDESEDELTERQKREQKDSLDTKHESWMKSKSARLFWAAEGDQEMQEDPSGGEQPPQGDPAQGGGDPAAMGGGQPMMPPPGSGAVAPPAPPAPLENQPAEDALLDTANQAIMQMIDQETAEYQQIIAPLSQALQAVQMAQQVEQTEHPMDVTSPEGTVDVSPSQAPGGAQNPQQQLARLMRQAQAQQRQKKVDFALRNAAHLIGNTYGVSERMLVAAMGRRQYEHVAEAFQILPPQARQDPYVQAAALHVGKMFAAENPMFSQQKWMESVIGQRTASNPRDRAGDAWRDGRDRGQREHGRQDMADAQAEDEQNHWEEDPEYRKLYQGSRSRLPFDRPRLAGENMKNTPTMDRFEFPNEQPEITDNMTINDLPKPQYKGLPKHKAERRLLGWGTKGVAPKMPKMPGEKSGDDVMGKYQRYTRQRAEDGLNFGDSDVTVENFLRDRKIGDEASGKLHNSLGINHPPVPKATAPKVPIPKAKNPVTKRGKFVNDPYGGYHTRDDDDPEHVFTNPRNGEKYMVQHQDGTVFKPGDALTNFRGDSHVLKGISKYPDYNSEGKITVGDGFGPEYYPKNYDAKIVPYTADWDPDKGQDPFDPRLIGASWGEWEPPNTVSFFTRKVVGWRWDDHLSGYLSKEARAFTCSCGEKIAAPSYRSCKCGKIWNVYAIGDTHHLASDTADMFIAREIEVRPGVIMANRKMAGFNDTHSIITEHGTAQDAYLNSGHPVDKEYLDQVHEELMGRAKAGDPAAIEWSQGGSSFDPDKDQDPFDPRLIGASRRQAKDGGCTCWEGYERVPGTEPCASKSCRKKTGARAQQSHAELIAMIDKLADWTKYDSPDPINDMGKSKPASTSVAKPPQDWATRLPKGDPSKKGGTWTRPTIPRKKK